MTIIDLTSGRDIEIEDEPQDLLDRDDALHSRQQFTPNRTRTVICFDDRTYTLEEFRAWVRRLADVETSTDPERAHVVEQMRTHLRQQDENASAVVGALSGQIRELQEDLRRMKAERDALIIQSGPQPIPRSVNGVKGCNCGGIDLHTVTCSLNDLDDDEAIANIDAAHARTIAYVASLPKPGAHEGDTT